MIAANGVGGVDAKASAGEVSCAAFRNSDGGMVVVLANRGPETPVQLVNGWNALDFNLESDSVHTIQWT